MYSTLRLLEVKDSPKCNKGDIIWHIRMQPDPPPVDTKARKLPKQCEEGDGTLGLAFPMIESQLPH